MGMKKNHSAWPGAKKILICLALLTIIGLTLMPVGDGWSWRTHGAVFGSRGITAVALERIVNDEGVSASVRNGLNGSLIRSGTAKPDSFDSSKHIMTGAENKGADWLYQVSLAGTNWDNVSYFMGLAGHYWGQLMEYSMHDNAKPYYENQFPDNPDAAYEAWFEKADHLKRQVEFYRPKDPALIVQGTGSQSTNYVYASAEPDPLVDGSGRQGSVSGGSITNTQSYSADGNYEQIAENNTATVTYTYVVTENETEGGAIDFDNAKADDGNYENIFENDYGGSGTTENREVDAVDGVDNGDSTGDVLSDAQLDDGVTYDVAKNEVLHFDSINTSGISGTITAAVLWVNWYVDSGYNGNNPIHWTTDEVTSPFANSTGIIPGPNDTIDNTASFDLYAAGVDTIEELENLDIGFLNNTGAAAYLIHFDYILVRVTYTSAAGYRFDISQSITGIPVNADNSLQVKYYTGGDTESISVYIYNFTTSNIDNAGVLQSGAGPYTFENTIDNDHISAAGEVVVEFIQPDSDATDSNLFVDYTRVATSQADYRLIWEHRITGVTTGRDNYELSVYGRRGTDGETVDVAVWNFTTSSWKSIGTMNTSDNLLTQYFSGSEINDYLSGGAMSVRYFENSADSTQTTIYLDYVVLTERWVSVGASTPYSSLSDFLAAEKSEIYSFIDKVMPPSPDNLETWMTGWWGDWINSRKCEETNLSVYASGNGNNIHYGSKELVDMATELVYSGWVYALGIQNQVSTRYISWSQWRSREHTTVGLWYYPYGG